MEASLLALAKSIYYCFPFRKDKEVFCNSSIIILGYFNMPLRSGFSIRAGSWRNSPAISCELAAYHVSLEITPFFTSFKTYTETINGS